MLPYLFRERIRIPWANYIDILARHKITPKKEVIESVIKGARRQEAVEDLTLSQAWDVHDSRFAEMRAQIYKERVGREHKQKEMLIEKLGFFQNQRLVEEENRVLKLLGKMYPGDEKIVALAKDFEERWARHIIAKRSAAAETDRLERTVTALNEDQQEWGKFLSNEMLKLIKKYPDAAYDFAIALQTMDFAEHALTVLQSAPDSLAKDWLMPEILLGSGRYIDCLEFLLRLERKYGSDPETTFAVVYLKAQAMWLLDQQTTAIELMQSVVNIRPGYRSAASLLGQWNGGHGWSGGPGWSAT